MLVLFIRSLRRAIKRTRKQAEQDERAGKLENIQVDQLLSRLTGQKLEIRNKAIKYVREVLKRFWSIPQQVK